MKYFFCQIEEAICEPNKGLSIALALPFFSFFYAGGEPSNQICVGFTISESSRVNTKMLGQEIPAVTSLVTDEGKG